MSRTEGPNTPSTRSMSSTYTQALAVPGVQTSKIRGVLRVSRVLIEPRKTSPSELNTPSNTLTRSTLEYKTLKYSEYYSYLGI